MTSRQHQRGGSTAPKYPEPHPKWYGSYAAMRQRAAGCSACDGETKSQKDGGVDTWGNWQRVLAPDTWQT